MTVEENFFTHAALAMQDPIQDQHKTISTICLRWIAWRSATLLAL